MAKKHAATNTYIFFVYKLLSSSVNRILARLKNLYKYTKLKKSKKNISITDFLVKEKNLTIVWLFL